MFRFSILVILLAVYDAKCCSPTSEPTLNGNSCSYLDLAIDMIKKAKESMPPCCSCPEIPTGKAIDCADLFLMGHKMSDVYKIWPLNRDKPLEVYCDMDTNGGGWTVIQRRGDFQNPQDYFNQNWTSYKEGFGDIKKEFWLGNDNIFALTNQKHYSVRFDLKDVNQDKKFAQYETFWIDNEENNYSLNISDYSGDAGNSMTSLSGNKFSTKERENRENTGCKRSYEGGWWYSSCHKGSLNGLNHKGKHESFGDGINWHSWKNAHESLEWTEIKIRPKQFMNKH